MDDPTVNGPATPRPATTARSVAHPPPALAPFVDADLLGPAEVHTAMTLARTHGDDRADLLLAAALAVRAPRRQHVCVDLSDVHRLVGDDRDPQAVAALAWPDPERWRRQLHDSPLVAVRAPDEREPPDELGRDVAPLTLAGDRLYLDRLWRYERRVAGQLVSRAARPVDGVDTEVLREGLARAFPEAPPDQQRRAAATAVLRHLAVIAGGPGTGKTTAVAQVLVLLDAQARARGQPPPTVALAAPTGKAAARLTGSLREAAARLDPDGDDAQLARLRTAEASTLHALLGPRGDHRSRFRHDRANPLPHDVVVVDETSMVSLALIAKLLDALRRDARLVLLGDPEQLASVEAGSVLGDVVGDHTRRRPPSRPAAELAARVLPPGDLGQTPTPPPDSDTPVRTTAGEATTAAPAAVPGPDTAGIDDAIVVLERVHRFEADSGIAAVAAAVQRGDADGAVAALRGAADVDWHEGDVDAVDLSPVRRDIVAAAAPVLAAADAGDAAGALAGLEHLRVLCAHRRGPAGVHGWVEQIEQWLAADVPQLPLRGRNYVGRPLLITANDRRLRLANGDVGVVVRGPDDRPLVALPAADGHGVRTLAPGRLPSVETVHAMTVHKSQGSQFAHVVVVLPDAASPLLTRELLYTALTRGQRRATVVGGEPAIRRAVTTRALRASGLADAVRLPRPA